MLPIPQPLPWHPLPNREIVDGAGNIVQYTQENIGVICLAINLHKTLMEAVLEVEKMTDNPAIIQLLRESTGRVGPQIVADMLSGAEFPSGDLDSAIAADLQIPIMDYTSSTDMAMALIPEDWSLSLHPGAVDPETNRRMGMVVELHNGDRKIVASHEVLSMAICTAAMRARQQ